MRISIREMRNQLGRLDALVAEERELIITRHNPIKGEQKRPGHQGLRDRLPYQEISSEDLQRQDREDR